MPARSCLDAMSMAFALVACAHVTAGVGLRLASQSRETLLSAAWAHDLAPEEGTLKNPIRRVVALMKKMKAELDHEAANEGEMYDKQVCWCETNEKEKEKAVKEADAKDKDLVSDIESRSARAGVLTSEIARLKKQISKDGTSQQEGQAVQEGEASDARGEEKDLVQAIANLKNAIRVLSKHQESSLAQLDAVTLTSIRTIFRDAALKHQMLFGNNIRRRTRLVSLMAMGANTVRSGERAAMRQHRAMLSALDVRGQKMAERLPVNMAAGLLARAAGAAGSASLLQAQARGPYKSYDTQSGGIFGILTQMLEDFESKLKALRDNSAEDAKAYKKLTSAKAAEIEVSKKKLDELEGERATNQKAIVDAKEDLELVRTQRSADVKFLQELQLTCQDLDKQWGERSKTRSQEITAVADAIAILTDDDTGVTLLQKRSQTRAGAALQARRARASALLFNAARNSNFQDLLADWDTLRGLTAAPKGPAIPAAASVPTADDPRMRLSTLAVKVKIDGFEKVKETIDTMVAELKKQQEEEASFKSYCKKELDDNEKETYGKIQEKKDVEAKVEEFDAQVAKLSSEVDEAQKQIAETKLAVKEASQTREQENSDFQASIGDQRAIQSVLKKALMRLQDVYKSTSLIQQTPPVQFTKYKSNGGAPAVISLIEQIIGDSEKLEAESTDSERSAQADYESFVKDANKLEKDLSKEVTVKTEAISGTKLDRKNAKDELRGTMNELDALQAVAGDLHSECDWFMKNFDVRQKARLQEMEAMQSAKGILSGAQ